jgi:hypothetical protein
LETSKERIPIWEGFLIKTLTMLIGQKGEHETLAVRVLIILPINRPILKV